MEQILEFFGNMFGAESWPARWVCGIWSPFHGWMYIISDLLIWAAYFVIPIYILRYINYKHKIELPKVFWLFAGFILLCGLTHLLDAIIFYWPAYRLSAFIRMLTAIVSWATVFAIIKVFPTLIRMKTKADYEYEIEQKEIAEAKLLKSNMELEQYAYVTSHDLQAPLKTIRAFASIIQEESKGEDNPDIVKSLAEINKGTLQMEEMIQDLLNYSRIGIEREIELIDLEVLLSDIIQNLDADINETKAKIETNINVGEIKAVKIEMRQLFQNLISNSIKFRNKDRNPIVKISIDHTPKGLKIVVSDNGIGIEQKYVHHIFDVFKRLHTKIEFEGTGIGLATCKKIVELYDGTIEAKSEIGQGTSMFVDLNILA